MKIALPFISLALVACASGSVWKKPGSTSDQFYMEQGQCSAQANSISNPGIGQASSVYEACMRGKGWKKAPKE